MGQMVCLVREDVAEGHFWPFYYCEAWLKGKRSEFSFKKLYEIVLNEYGVVTAGVCGWEMMRKKIEPDNPISEVYNVFVFTFLYPTFFLNSSHS